MLNGRKRGQSRKELLPRRARFGLSASSAGCPDSANTSITHQLPLIGMIGMARADPSAEEAGSLCDLSTPRGKPHRRSHRGTEHFCRAKIFAYIAKNLLFKGLLMCAESKTPLLSENICIRWIFLLFEFRVESTICIKIIFQSS